MLPSKKPFDIPSFKGNIYYNTETNEFYSKGVSSLKNGEIIIYKSIANCPRAQQFF
ncbi:hypothetical protein Lbir_1322 [Legionella birminghamensis]|uniref:Uncharacterized protein n=1 Tax=Legionella birminghamensis TaxID=28083 RepID=A0A378IJ02_9GAMM|nr:hypothetical protein [Legionella birminghamensis]KTC72547.1 hypothetical protein Lbir_1322 [Legionella birminghamensis]STX32144.1 Uncharacterised protein [Legionella birminghamensis]